MRVSTSSRFQSSFSKEKSQILPSTQNSYLFMHPSKMKILEYVKESLILLHTEEGQLLFKCCPSASMEPNTLISSPSGLFEDYFKGDVLSDNYNLLLGSADMVVLNFNNLKSFMETESFKKFIKKLLDPIYIREGLKLNFSYLCQPCCLTVKNIYSHITDIITNQEGVQEICKNISSLNISGDDSVLDSSYDERSFTCSTPISSKNSENKKWLHKRTGKHSSNIQSNQPKQFYFIHSKTKIFVENQREIKLNEMTFQYLGGLKKQINEVKLLVHSLLNQDSVHEEWCHGIILVGAPGTGKTAVVQAIKNEFNVPLFNLSADIYNSSNDVECKYELKKLCNEIIKNSPSILFVDNIDSLSKNGDATHESLVVSLSNMIYDFQSSRSNVLVIATAHNIMAVDASLRKPGTLEKEIYFEIPSADDRKEILTKILDRRPHKLSSHQIEEISELTHGFTGGDLKHLCDKAYISSYGRNFDAEVCISFDELRNTLKDVKPSSMVEFMFEVPKVKWSDIGGMQAVKTAVTEMVDWPLKHAEQYKKFNITPSRGILLYGPPGCSKTMIAKALVSESHLNFISIKGPQLFNKYVGESEKAVSELFKKARSAAPCVLFFDEIDSLASIRGSSSGSSNVAERILTQLLVEIDGIDVLQGVSIIAATNRPDMIDPSFLRPGRFDQMIYVPLPDYTTRREIFEAKLKNMPVATDLDVSYLVEATEGYTGAEITDVCREAAMSVIKDYITSPSSVVTMFHFLTALKSVVPRTSKEMLKFYENYNKRSLR